MAGDPISVTSNDDVAADGTSLDPRRWLTLTILILTVVLIALDTSVLNVAIPTMLREFDTTVPALQWVITGYSLTFASLLIIGGRLGDIYGHRRLFIIGTALFGVGSFIASISTSVGMLIVGEAVIEGVGAALMTPSTLALLSMTFPGRERAKAFAAWGAAAGAAVAFGPVLGGYLTTNHSWRWAFRINVIVAPVAAIGALLLMKPGRRNARRPIDLPGAALVTAALFLAVFALSDGGTYGWLEPLKAFRIAGTEIWPASMPVSIVPVAILVAIALLGAFVVVEQRKVRRRADPLFDFTLLQLRSFRYGLLTTQILAMGQLALLFALPLFLQDAMHLSAERNGLWMLPMGLFVIVGAQGGGRLTRRVGIASVVTYGLMIEIVGLLLVIWSVQPGITFWRILPGLIFFGIGIGFASSQLTSVVLSEVMDARAGVASGANSTCRQIGAAFGIAIVGSIITVQATNRAVAALGRADLPPAVRDRTIADVRALGPSARAADNLPAADVATIERILTESIGSSVRIALGFAVVLVFSGALLSLLIPRVRPQPASAAVGLGPRPSIRSGSWLPTRSRVPGPPAGRTERRHRPPAGVPTSAVGHRAKSGTDRPVAGEPKAADLACQEAFAHDGERVERGDARVVDAVLDPDGNLCRDVTDRRGDRSDHDGVQQRDRDVAGHDQHGPPLGRAVEQPDVALSDHRSDWYRSRQDQARHSLTRGASSDPAAVARAW